MRNTYTRLISELEPPQILILPAAAFSFWGMALALGAISSTVVPVEEFPPLDSASSLSASNIPQNFQHTTFIWPTLFGDEMRNSDVSTSNDGDLESEIVSADSFTYDSSSIILRGLLSDGRGGGIAVIEFDEEQLIVSEGGQLPDGAVVRRVSIDGVELEMNHSRYLVEFQSSLNFGVSDAQESTILPTHDSLNDKSGTFSFYEPTEELFGSHEGFGYYSGQDQ